MLIIIKNNVIFGFIKPFLDTCLLGKKMSTKPDVLVLLAGVVALGALLTGLITPDNAQTAMIVSENMIR